MPFEKDIIHKTFLKNFTINLKTNSIYKKQLHQDATQMTYKFWLRITYNDIKSVRFPSSFGSVPDSALMPKLLIYWTSKEEEG